MAATEVTTARVVLDRPARSLPVDDADMVDGVVDGIVDGVLNGFVDSIVTGTDDGTVTVAVDVAACGSVGNV